MSDDSAVGGEFMPPTVGTCPGCGRLLVRQSDWRALDPALRRRLSSTHMMARGAQCGTCAISKQRAKPKGRHERPQPTAAKCPGCGRFVMPLKAWKHLGAGDREGLRSTHAPRERGDGTCYGCAQEERRKMLSREQDARRRAAALAEIGGPESGEDDPMTPAEFAMVRAHLGLTGEWLAEYLGVALRTVRRWEQGAAAIPDGVRAQVEELEAITAEQVAALVSALRGASEVTLGVPQATAGGFPARWWLMVAARVAEEVPGLTVRYVEH